jgi:hypothetical protein
VHHNGLDAELAARALDTQRDLAAIGDQDLVEQLSGVFGRHERFRAAAMRRREGRARN